MKVIQLVSNLNYGDAIGEEVIFLHSHLRKRRETCIVALHAHSTLERYTTGTDFPAIQHDDIVIFHKASGDSLTSLFRKLSCKKVLLYHNITPPSFFIPYDLIRTWNQWRGRRQLKTLSSVADWAWGDSEYNCNELISYGFNPKRVAALPICLPFEEQNPPSNLELEDELHSRAGAKILFVGRIAPNKKQEDIIKAFYYYQKRIDPQARLYLIGSYLGNEKYYAKLMGFIDDLGLRHVVITGRISDEDKWSYYRCADLMLCMSEHEGFCVPLLEAMACDVPILAYASCAVPETLGDTGQLFTQKDYPALCERMRDLITDQALRDQVVSKQRQSLQRFTPEQFQERFEQLLQAVIGENAQ